jgi:hypothetical protein
LFIYLKSFCFDEGLKKMSDNRCSVCKRDDVPLFFSQTADLSIYCGEKCQRIGVYVTPNPELIAAVNLLQEQGYCVIRVFTDEETAERHTALRNALYNLMPEYLANPELLVRGGFGALGNSSSFHLPIVRQLRREAHQVAAKLFKMLLQQRNETMLLEQLVDRARILRPNSEIKEEIWHRDQTPRKNPSVTKDDRIFGGWISFNGTQKFSAIKGSHMDVVASNNQNSGFTPLTKEESAKYTEQKNKVLEKSGEWFIEIPPGHMLIFQQELIHEVVGGKHRGEEQLRLFTGWRLTTSKQSFIKNPHEFFVEQGITNIKSDQTPDMYPDMPWSAGTTTRRGLATWSAKTFQPFILEERKVASGKDKGESHTLVPKHMYSLYEISIKKAAWRVSQELSEELESKGVWEFPESESEKAAIFDAAQIIATTPPAVWQEKRLFQKPSQGELIWDTPYFEVQPKDRVLFEPYTPQDKMILTPLSLV